MDAFSLFIQQGFTHITDLNGYDHMLFILALSLNYTYKNWKQLAILITAFTIGHSISLALSVLDIVTVSPDLVETLIPITILITALKHVVQPKSNTTKEAKVLYLITLMFGVIHGLGFSNYLNFLLTESEDLTVALAAFNIGLELGQILVLALIICFQFFLFRVFSIKTHHYRLFLGILVSLVSLYLIFS